MICKNCSAEISVPKNAVAPIHCRCGATIYDLPAHLTGQKPWPYWAEIIAKRRFHCEVGVGSTVKRIADKRGGKQFKRIAQWLSIPCGCTERMERWNREYPYAPDTPVDS